MQKAIVYKAHNGAIIVDERPNAEICLENIKYTEERILKEHRREMEHKQKRAKNPLWKMVCACGMM